MRRFALLLVLGTVAFSRAGSSDYVKLRTQNGIHQAVGGAALREVLKPKVLEIQGKVNGTCRADGTTILIFERVDGETQEVEAASVPDWLADGGAAVRLLVRCFREERGASLRTVLLAAAPELDVLPVEEAYWRGLAAKRNAAAPRPRMSAPKPPASRGSLFYGRIGGRNVARREWILPASEVTPRYAAFIQSRNHRLSSGKATEIAQAVVGFSIQYRVDARLVMAMLIVESDFDPDSVSRSGAVGLGQLMPGTAQWMGVRNSFDTTDNLYGTVKLLRTHLDQYRTSEGVDLARTLAAYNAGMGAVKRYNGVPPYRETQAYVRKVTGIYDRLCGR